MNKYILRATGIFILLAIGKITMAQTGGKTRKLVMVALDGMRWQEIFGGVDSSLMNDGLYTKEKKDMQSRYWHPDINERRKKLMPFFWSTLATKGQLYGNRNAGSLVNVANPYHFTYPGFSETLTGNPDSAVNSNRLVPNKNANVLEFINRQPGYAGKVAIFTTSDLFPFLLNKWRNGLIVNSDNDSLPYPSPVMQLLNDMEHLANKPTGERPDLLTYFAAREYLKTERPKILYIALGETDAFAHDGSYDQYIGTAHAEDGMIADLWKLLQSMPGYKDETTMILTCDHGRGSRIRKDWTDHGTDIPESSEIWIAVIGPDTSPKGEIRENSQIWQGQLAATMAAFLGMSYQPNGQKMLPVAEALLH